MSQSKIGTVLFSKVKGAAFENIKCSRPVPNLAQLLSEYYTNRNAEAWNQNAKIGNLKKFNADAPDKSSGKWVQPIHIKYDRLSFTPLDELMKKETA